MPASSPGRLLDIHDLEAVLLGPAHIHPHEHIGPVLALGAAGAGVHFEIAVVGVGFAGEQRLELATRHLGLEMAQRLFRFADDAGVVLGFAEFDHRRLVVELPLDLGDGAELILERGALLHQAAGALRIVPQAGSSAWRLSSSSRARALSTSKMPPQQSDRLLDLGDDIANFRAHGVDLRGAI